MVKLYEGYIPFFDSGSMMYYAYTERDPNNPNRGPGYSGSGKWIKNFEFRDQLKIMEANKGRSAVNFTWKSMTSGKEYKMFLSNLIDTLENSDCLRGIVEGKWSFVKKGANYGIVYLGV